jgi:hypothetical protein
VIIVAKKGLLTVISTLSDVVGGWPDAITRAILAMAE